MVAKTRPAKRQADPSDLVADWWRRAEGHGFDREALSRCTGVRHVSPTIDRDDVFRRLAAPDGLCAGTSIFTRADVLAELVDIEISDVAGLPGPLLLPADDLERLADDFLASDLVVELVPDDDALIKRLAGEPIFSTAEMLRLQTRLLERFRAGRSTGLAVVPPDILGAALAEHDQLTAEQRALVTAFCTSGHRAQCAVGRAGAGKTTAMRAAVAAWRASGYRVVGTAVKGEAARHLGAEAAIESETLAWHLAHDDPASSPLDARTVLIVDESGTVSDRDLDRLLWLADATGATVRLIGDPAQHGAVGAGGMFAVLCDDAPDTPELRASHRVGHPHDRAAADALRDGRIADALAALDAAGHLHIVSNEVDLYLDLLQRWWDSRRTGAEHPMVDRRNHTRHQLNRLAHRLLQLSGEIGTDEIAGAHERRFSVGDRVVAKIGDRNLHPPGRPRDYVRNGATGTIIELCKDKNHTRDAIRVAFDGIGEVDLPRSFFDLHHRPGQRRDVGLDHAYAVTSYAVQGATFTESTSRIDANASRSETYVDITRGRAANHLYLTRAVDPLDGEHLPKAPPLPLPASVAMHLSWSGPERPAISVDPAAERRARKQHGGVPVARGVPNDLDSALVSRLPWRIRVPFLARMWDETAREIFAYLTRAHSTPGGARPFDWALGPLPADPYLQRRRGVLATRITDLVVATQQEMLRARSMMDLPSWAGPHLAYHAARGRCMHDPAALQEIYEQIASYRSRVGIGNEATVSGSEEALLGPVPDNPALRLERQSLIDAACRRRSVPRRAGSQNARIVRRP